jgi:hypothetical protein
MVEQGKIFLCFGDPKSGTTFLQRLLNLHPQISCPSEQKFSMLRGYVEEVCRAYSNVLAVVDQRTGGQGAPTLGSEASAEVFRSVVEAFAGLFASGKPIRGLNDNDVFLRPDYYDRLFNRPGMIAIVRNPVDQATSAWRHNQRLAREEPQNASMHLSLLANPAGTLEGYVRHFSAGYRRRLNNYLDYADGRTNFLTVRFESLVADKGAELHRILAFLGADNSPVTIERMAVRSTPAAMAAVSSRPQFFGLDDPEKRTTIVGDGVRRQVFEECWSSLQRAGYPSLAALMPG